MLPADHRPNDPLATERDFNGDPTTIDDRVDRIPEQRRTPPLATVALVVLVVIALVALIAWIS